MFSEAQVGHVSSGGYVHTSSSALESGDSTFMRPASTFDRLMVPTAANDNGWLPKVVGLSGQAGSGKSTAADYFVKNGYTRVRFAGPLKAMARAIGLQDEHIEGDRKEMPLDMLCGKTPRYFMQRLGTEFGRDLIGKDFWIGLWLMEARHIIDGGGRVVSDDCRFENEVEAIRELGGKIGRVVGRGGIAGGHSSEAYTPDADFTLNNSGNLFALHLQIATWLRHAA